MRQDPQANYNVRFRSLLDIQPDITIARRMALAVILNNNAEAEMPARQNPTLVLRSRRTYDIDTYAKFIISSINVKYEGAETPTTSSS